ncbi:hypothetical protein HYH03_002721 [Edaphochlamys debaryana]|uniref:Midasin n=1 Tax=Edaphochlamys debaryana TaxID=47281 RepID=A0A836C4P8_9CHLO|nr:hypothetical protein HYH03_002721 [Edaphochlamys debaryana]|eukprot:KAG2499138.1 hypothetical protein HYH03_002721 [Edaphochlamys debaryana]
MEAALRGFLERYPDAKNEPGLARALAEQASLEEVASALEALLVQPVYTLALGSALRGCGSLLRLLSLLVDRRLAGGAAAASARPDAGPFAVMLVTVLELAPQCGRVVQRYLEAAATPQELAAAAQPGAPAAADLAAAALRALQLLPGLRQHPAWAAGPFMRLLQHQSDQSRSALASQLLTAEQQVAATASWQARSNAVALEQAAMWLQAPGACGHCAREAEAEREAGAQAAGGGAQAVEADGADAWASGAGGGADPLGLPPARGFVEVCGIELACRDTAEAAEAASALPGTPATPSASAAAAASNTSAGHCFVATPTVRRNLEAAALVLCQGLPLLLEGPPGAGKTRLVEELAARTGNGGSLVRVHLDDQMDAKSLLGAYVCTAVPGEFAWQPGPLTQAVAEGRWVLVEDINMAPGDVIAALAPLLESRVLHVSSRGQVVPAAPGFQIIATVTTAPTSGGGGAHHGGAYGMSNMVKELLGGLWRTVRVDAPSDSEQMALLSTAFPQLLPLLPAAVGTLCLIQAAGGHDGGQSHAHAHAQTQPQSGGTAGFQLTPAGPKAAGADAGAGAGAGAQAAAPRRGPWHALAEAALEAAGLRRGELALHLGRHFSLRDVFKWCGRMRHLHSGLLRNRTYSTLLRSHRKASEKSLPAAAAAAAAATPSADGGPAASATDLGSLEPRLREAAFVEAADCFAALVAKPEARGKLLKALAALWCAPPVAPEQWESLAKPQLSEVEGGGERQLLVGRVALPVAEEREAERDAAAAGGKGAAGSGAAGCGGGSGGTFARTGHAMRVMERIAAALSCNEPVLLVGETGTGKTTMLSRMASLVGAQLVSFNLSQQTDASDLLGGFKPVEPRDALAPLLPTFTALIRRTWTKGNNDEYLSRVRKLAERRKWSQLLAAFRGALGKVHAASDGAAAGGGGDAEAAEAAAEEGGKPAKKRKTAKEGNQPLSESLRHEWRLFSSDLAAAERAAAVAEGGFAFAFVEGVLVKALRNGWWLLLDEINLAPPEVLERLAGLLETAGNEAAGSSNPAVAGASGGGSVVLLERGDTVAVPRHPNFRLVAAMNPATDAGKHELPAALRNRFTEMWVPEPAGREDLAALVAAYLAGVGPAPPVDPAVDFYLAAKAEAESRLVDGAGQKPAYNLRTLSRALDYARAATPSYGLQRALYDGAAMAFLTQLAPGSAPRMEALVTKHLLPGVKNVKALLRAPPEPQGGSHTLFEAFWLERGPLELPAGGREEDGSGRKFVMTPSVRQHLTNLARAVLIRKHPILLQGPTSAGKTSLVAYLAAQTGHTFLRINNHEHTDLQEYLGSYVSDASGRLVFREGPLVQAVRRGWWVVLDELNLAPTEVLEALNRLLDDNRELLVPELGEVVRPHPHFMLFATQNPPGGAYAGRKVLSRAFRSRFLELHIDDIPDAELATILEKRCAVAPSYANKLVAVQRELQRRRNAHSVFAGKHGFITPRDLFRWAERGAVGYEALAADGALLLGERLRSAPERAEVVGVVEKVMNVKVDLDAVYAAEGDAPLRALEGALAEATAAEANGTAGPAHGAGGAEAAGALQGALRGVVWTRSMRRMYTLVERCLRHSEPVLLVGETGTGKTTVCQLLALMRRQQLHILNCNQLTETSDFLGGFRPTRGRERALGAFLAAAHRVAASPLLAALKQAPPAVPAEVLPQGISPLAAEVAAAAAAAVKAVGDLDAKGRRELKKAIKAAAKAAGVAVGGGGDVDQAVAALEGDAKAATASALEARAPFAWADGPLVTAMRRGDMILIDEINLAEDAVLERLNSVLEPGRTLTLAERGGEGAEVVVAAPGFRLLATMNPGGDFGKKELSPALANRFTTVWVPAMEDAEEMRAILEARLAASFDRAAIAERLLRFWQEYARLQPPGARQPLSIRDLLAWVGFVNATHGALGPLAAYAHGAHLTLLDGIGLGVGLPAAAAAALRSALCAFLASQLPPEQAPHAALAEGRLSVIESMSSAGLLPLAPPSGSWGIAPFYVELPPGAEGALPASGRGAFALASPTTARNAFRLLRALQLKKAILLEGSPGVGKTSLVAALAKRLGQSLVRINLSEQTDMMDLLGADLPAVGGAPGQFAWCDGPLLGALKAGAWVLLDELNLAGQSVLEGLNALLDHRSEVFIPELCATFRCHPRFRLFAAQNPLGEGGGRKGLPRSFLNRFTRVSVELLRRDDLLFIASALHPRVPAPLLTRMVDLLDAMQTASTPGGAGSVVPAAGEEGEGVSAGATAAAAAGVRDFAAAGGPWEFNLRDLLRWCDLVEGAVPAPPALASAGPDAMDTGDGEGGAGAAAAADEAAALDAAAQHFARMLFAHRLRTPEDRAKLARLFEAVWGCPPSGWADTPSVLLSPGAAVVGRAILPRAGDAAASVSGASAAAAAAASASPPSGGASASAAELQLLPWSLPLLESLAQTLSRSWMALLVGGPGSGKTSLARAAAALAGVRLLEVALTAGTDTSDLLGSFEQLEPERRVQEASDHVQQLAQAVSQRLLTLSASTDSASSSLPLEPEASPAGVPADRLTAAERLQAAWSTHTAAVAAAERQADAPSPIAAAAARVGSLRTVLAAARDGAALLSSTAAADASSSELASAADAADAELAALAALLADEAAAAVGGRFEWVDGALTRAIERGGWVLLEGANLCNPTVLDRLNPLLEPGGALFLNECGTTADGPRVIHPHPDFRLILALDPRHGEVSRAMRNRGTELFLLPPPPPAAPAALPGKAAAAAAAAEVVDEDVETVARAAGVASKRLLRALAAAHGAVCALARRGHKRPPGLREAATAAALAAALLARGWRLEAAVRTGWSQVYLRGQGYSPAEAAEAQQVLEALVRNGVLAEALPAAPPAAEQDGGMDWEGPGSASAAASAAAADADGGDGDGADLIQCLARPDGTLSADEARQALAAQPLVPRRLEQGMLAAPAAWPTAASVQRLAAASAAAGAERDVALLSYLLGAAVAVAAVSAAAGGGAEPGRQRQLLSGLQAALRGAAGGADGAAAAAALLCHLPVDVTTPVIHGGVDGIAVRPAAATSAAAGPHLHQLVWATAQCLAQRASLLDARLRVLMVEASASQARAAAALAAAAAGDGGDGTGGLTAAAQLAALAAELTRALLTHPLAAQLAASTAAAAAAAGMPLELRQLQPLDLRYGDVLLPYLPGVPYGEWAAAQQRSARLRAAAVAAAAAALLRHAAAGADVAVGRGEASPLQVSYWRSMRPDERAASDAEHPALDVAYPLLAALGDLEAALLDPAALPDAAWDPQPPAAAAAADDGSGGGTGPRKGKAGPRSLEAAFAEAQAWRSALWRCLYGPLHAAAAADVDAGLDVPLLTWTWSRADKALAAFAARPDVAAALAAAPAAADAAARLEYLRSQGREALGLGLRGSKPLAWRLCGKPVLPSSSGLLGSLVACRQLAAGSAAAAVDARGRPLGLEAAGMDLDETILSVAAAAAAEGGSGLAADFAAGARSLEELAGEEAPGLRQAVAEAVASALCVDPALRRAALQGLAMLGSAPLLEALRPGSNTPGSGSGSEDRAALAAQGENVVSALREALQARVREAAAGVLGCPSEDEWLMRQGAALASASASTAVAAAGLSLLLPAAWMASRTCRQLQAALLGLQDCYSLRSQLPLLTAAAETATLWSADPAAAAATAGAGGDGAARQRARWLAALARAAVDSASAGSTRSAVDMAAAQQLAWVLDLYGEQLDGQARGTGAKRGPAGPSALAARKASASAAAAIAGAAAAAGLDVPTLCQAVLPALAHELWLGWHGAAWRSAFGDAAGGSGVACPPGVAGLEGSLLGCCVLRVLRSSASQVQSKPMRLRQLRCAVATMLCSGGSSSGSGSGSGSGLALTASAAAAANSAEWRALACLLSQLLLAHASSLPDPEDAAALRAACGRLMAAAAGGGSPPPPGLAAELSAALAAALRGTRHALLSDLLESVLLPAFTSVADGITSSSSSRSHSTPSTAAAAAPTAAVPELSAARGLQAARAADTAARGRSWLLLGLARLHLVVPPPGIDPAGKHALKRAHLEGRLLAEVQPEMLVRKALHALPGGPSEAPHLERLAAARDGALAAAEAAATRCVPRPQPSQYPALQAEVADFAAGLAAPRRVLALAAALGGGGGGVAVTALAEAEVWSSNARAWCERFGRTFAWYPDLAQPVQQAVLEMARGVELLAAAAAERSTSAAAAPAALQVGPAAATAMGLLRFPSASAAAAAAFEPRLLELSPRLLAEPSVRQMLDQVARSAAAAALAAAHSAAAADPAKAAAAAELAGYEMQLRATRVALHALARDVLARGGAAAATATADAAAAVNAAPAAVASAVAPPLGSLERLLESLVEQWAALKAYEEAVAEEEAQQFKTKASNSTFMNEDQELDATYRSAFPDHFDAFADVAPPLDPREQAAAEEEAEREAAEADAAAARAGGEQATATQAKSSGARQLLDGELLSDVVRLHSAVYGSLAAEMKSSVAATSASVAAADADADADGSASTAAGFLASPDALRQAFLRSYELGCDLMLATGCRLGPEADAAAESGHLYRLCLEHNHLNRQAAATAADAAGGAATNKRGATGKAAAGSGKRTRGGVIFGDGEDSGVDIQAACVEEVSLLQEPVAAMESRLRSLLADYPDHPLLGQLRAIALRLLALPLTAPLKTALTGLELLLSRAQVWEETAASFVSLKAQLGPVAALATRWRRLELGSWKGLLRRVAARHASGAHRSWFHLHRLLAAAALHGDGSDSGSVDAAVALAASGVPVLIGMASVPAMISAAADGSSSLLPRDASSSALSAELEASYRRVASTLESFVQTSTLGEFRSRLAMLRAFGAHVEVRRAEEAAGGAPAGPLAAPLAAALANLNRYYGQFAGAVDAALAQGMAPLEKDLQDFVQLAKWDDRGYYALRASTEKAQRYLHRLSRRAEDVLKEPAATALAKAVKGMGVPELAAAAAAAAKADGAELAEAEAAAAVAGTVAAVAEAGKKGDGKEKGKDKAAEKAKPVVKARPKKLTPQQAAEAAEAAELAGVTGAEADGAAEADAADPAARWSAFAAAVQSGLAADTPLQAALTAAAAAAAPAGASAAGSAYLPRLPQLASRLGRIVADSLRPPPPATADADGDADADAMTPDALAAAAIVRSHELRSDIAKGARMRKRQALSDLYEALEGQGLSRRQTAVPPHDRDVASWFKHPEPAPAPLWQLPAAAGAAAPPLAPADAAAAAAAWGRADDYYYRSMARLQKLWAAAVQPHRDLSGAEASAARRLCEHALFVARRQRAALGGAADAFASLSKLTAWLQEEAASAAAAGPASAAPGGAASAGGGSGSQAEALAAVQQQKAQLDSLALLSTETVQLLDACVTTAALPSATAQLATAVAAARVAASGLAGCKRRLDAALQACSVTVAAPPADGGGAGSQLIWVTRGCLDVALDNCRTLVKVESDLAAAVEAAAALSGSAATAGAPGLTWIPALDELRRGISAASTEAAAWLAARQAHADGAAAAGADAAPPADLVEATEALVRSVLLWAQPPAAAPSQGSAAPAGSAAAAAAPLPRGALVPATTELEAGLKLPRASDLNAAAAALLRRLAEAPDGAAGSAAARRQAAAALLRGAVPMLRLAAEALRLKALQLLALHRSTAKLSYVCTAVLATLMEEGYCVPEEGKETQAGDGPGEFKEAEGTGLGDGQGAKDISDQLENQDQLLGAQQRGKEPKEEEDKQGGPEDQGKGIEMDDDFEGEMHDMPMDEQDKNRDSDDEEGDDERIDQQMGDVGDNEEVVDEKLWNDDDDEGKGDEEQKKKKEEKYEKNAPIQVEDKTDLEYAAGQEEEEEQGGKEAPKKEQKKQGDQGPDQPEAGEEEEEEDEGRTNEDTDDKYEDKHHAAPQAAEEELELPDDLNLDGAEAGEEEEPQGGAEEDEAGKQGAEEQEAAKEDDGKQGPDEEAGKEADGEDKPGGDGADGDMDLDEQEEGLGGIGEAEAPEPQPGDDAAPEPEPMAVDRPEEGPEEEGAGEQPPGAEEQQAGPHGVASGAPTQQPEATGAAHGAPEEARPQPNDAGDAAGQKAPDQGEGAEDDPSRAPDTAPAAKQTDVGRASAAAAGAPAPLTGGDREEGGVQQPPQQRGPRRQAEPNPLRSLGDALERWRASLAVQHEAAPPQGGAGAGGGGVGFGRRGTDDEAGAGSEEGADEGADAPPPAGAEFQFLGADEQRREGDTQALAPATDEQAAQQADQLDEPGMQQQRRDEQQQQQEAGDDGAAAMEEDAPEEEGGEEGADEGAGKARSAVASGPVPRTWGGRQRKGKLGGEGADGQDGEEEGKEEEEQRPDPDDLLRQREDTDPDAEPSRVVARLAAASLADPPPGPSNPDAAASDLAPALPRGLSPEQAAALRQQLDERLRGAAAAAADADVAYGGEVWSRCEALVSGLAGELTEQLRLILEPTLASKLAGDYRTGKRINMKKVIGYIASHFRRDKIWLRRSRPDKRRYQVLLACDDSRSMAENGCGGFALEALALMCKAMSRLEVGQVGVIKFGGGEGVVPLHPLGAPFSDSVGPSLAARLTFKQDNTIADRPMLQLMESLDPMLDAARHSSGAGGIGAGTQDLAQLVLVLADGRFHEKESLHAAVRAAAAKRGVCLAFIALDSPDPQHSLLDMASVSFQAGKPVFTKYLDTFPFPYYILLKDIASLPATLADLLRQWFELSAV